MSGPGCWGVGGRATHNPDCPSVCPSVGPNIGNLEDTRPVGKLSAILDTCFPPCRSQPYCPLLQEALPDHTGSYTPSRVSQPSGFPSTAHSGWPLSGDGSVPCTGLRAPGGPSQVVLITTGSPAAPCTEIGLGQGLRECVLDTRGYSLSLNFLQVALVVSGASAAPGSPSSLGPAGPTSGADRSGRALPQASPAPRY